MNKCNCSIIGITDAGDYLTVSSQKIVKARKHHKCEECDQIINPGDFYELFKGCWDGKWADYRTCADCSSIKEVFFLGFTFGMLWEDFRSNMYDCGFEIPEQKLSKLTKKAREKVCDLIESYWSKL